MTLRPISLLLASFAFASGAALTGCADDGGSGEATLNDADQEIAVHPRDVMPIGTFRSSKVHIGELTLLVLKDDGTFHSGIAAACAMPVGSCTPQRDGLYQITQRSPDAAYLYLYHADGTPLDQYEYVVTGDTLHLRRMSSVEWRMMSRAPAAWCAEASDCETQNLGEMECGGRWNCAMQQCRYSCDAPTQ